MKPKKLLLPILAGGALILPSWGEPAQLIQAEAKQEASASAVDVDALAKKLGFAAHVSKNTEGYFSVIDASDMFDRLKNTDLGKFMIEMAGAQGGDLDEMENDDDFQIVKTIIGEEFFAAFGDTSGDQAEHLLAFSKSSNFHQMKMMVKMAAAGLTGEDIDEEAMTMGMISSLMGSPEAGIAILEKSEMPPLTLGFKVSDKDKRDQLSETMIGGLISLTDNGAPFEEIDEKKGDLQLNGIKIVGQKIAEMADADDRAEMEQVFGSAAAVERIMKALASKNLHIAIGVKGDYIFVHLGADLEGLNLVDKPADSLLANAGMDFLKNYADKDLRMFLFGEESAWKQLNGGNEAVASMMKGIKEGLSETEAFGDTRDIQALLGHVAKVEGQLFDMLKGDRAGMVGFLEDGFKMESHGSTNLPSLDHENNHTFSSLGEMEDVLYFSNSRSNPEFTGKLYDMLDSLGQASYLLAGRVAEMDIDDGDFRGFRDFKEGFGMFDEMAAGDLKEIWKAFTTDWAQGTGDEGALIIDTKGTLPRVPEVPGAIIEDGRIPRIAYVTPVTDREKMSKAWVRIEKSIANILKTVKEMEIAEIPMQEIDDNTKDGITYYSTAIQFSTKDARPVVGLNDDHFFFSTSQKFIAELREKAIAGGGPERTGSYSRLNFAAARGLAEYWVNLLKNNADDIFENDFQKDDFNENLPIIEKAIKAFAQFEHLTSHTRMEDGEARSSLHFKMK